MSQSGHLLASSTGQKPGRSCEFHRILTSDRNIFTLTNAVAREQVNGKSTSWKLVHRSIISRAVSLEELSRGASNIWRVNQGLLSDEGVGVEW
jgi:hypothetical protein